MGVFLSWLTGQPVLLAALGVSLTFFIVVMAKVVHSGYPIPTYRSSVSKITEARSRRLRSVVLTVGAAFLAVSLVAAILFATFAGAEENRNPALFGSAQSSNYSLEYVAYGNLDSKDADDPAAKPALVGRYVDDDGTSRYIQATVIAAVASSTGVANLPTLASAAKIAETCGSTAIVIFDEDREQGNYVEVYDLSQCAWGVTDTVKAKASQKVEKELGPAGGTDPGDEAAEEAEEDAGTIESEAVTDSGTDEQKAESGIAEGESAAASAFEWQEPAYCYIIHIPQEQSASRK